MVSINSKQNRLHAKERILSSSITLFADKGFDATSVELIAKEADVTKSLIYYHFKSKNQILDVLIDDFIDKFEKLVKKRNDKNAQVSNRKTYYDFLSENEDLVRVAIIESFKKMNDEPPILKLLDVYMRVKGKSDNIETYASELYTNLIPTASFICFGNKFCQKYHLAKKEYFELFADCLAKIHTQFY